MKQAKETRFRKWSRKVEVPLTSGLGLQLFAVFGQETPSGEVQGLERSLVIKYVFITGPEGLQKALAQIPADEKEHYYSSMYLDETGVELSRGIFFGTPGHVLQFYPQLAHVVCEGWYKSGGLDSRGKKILWLKIVKVKPEDAALYKTDQF